MGDRRMTQKPDVEFTARHHAFLFSSIAKAVVHELGEKDGERLIRKAVAEYGCQRGKRMAKRATENGHPLTVENYFAYGEWSVPKGEMDFKLENKGKHARLTVFRCPWHDSWKDRDLLAYGKYYCLEIDAALVHGFNPALGIEVNATRTNDNLPCEFVFKNGRLSLFKMAGLLYKKKVRPGKTAIMPWAFHISHLYDAMDCVICGAIGDERGQAVMADALKEASFFTPENT